jgi:hypothetical protein
MNDPGQRKDRKNIESPQEKGRDHSDLIAAVSPSHPPYSSLTSDNTPPQQRPRSLGILLATATPTAQDLLVQLLHPSIGDSSRALAMFRGALERTAESAESEIKWFSVHQRLVDLEEKSHES